MGSDDHAFGFVAGQGFSRDDWDEVSDNPETTEEEQAQAQPMVEALPELVAAMRRKRGTPKVATKDLITLRLDKDVLATLRSGGSGWQSRVNAMLREALALDVYQIKHQPKQTLVKLTNIINSKSSAVVTQRNNHVQNSQRSRSSRSVGIR